MNSERMRRMAEAEDRCESVAAGGPLPMEAGMFHERDGMFFQRQPNGDVRLIKTSNCLAINKTGSNILLDHTIPADVWVSVVLSMSAYDERPGDWHIYREHHFGTMDLMARTTCPE